MVVAELLLHGSKIWEDDRRGCMCLNVRKHWNRVHSKRGWPDGRCDTVNEFFESVWVFKNLGVYCGIGCSMMSTPLQMGLATLPTSEHTGWDEVLPGIFISLYTLFHRLNKPWGFLAFVAVWWRIYLYSFLSIVFLFFANTTHLLISLSMRIASGSASASVRG